MYKYTLVLRENMSLVYLKNKKNGFKYVYECISFWNKEKNDLIAIAPVLVN